MNSLLNILRRNYTAEYVAVQILEETPYAHLCVCVCAYTCVCMFVCVACIYVCVCLQKKSMVKLLQRKIRKLLASFGRSG